MTHLFAGTRINGSFPGRENPLPAGLPRRIGVFPGKRLGDINFPETRLKITMVEVLCFFDLSMQLIVQIPGQDGGSVLASLAAPDKDEILAEINVLDA